GHKNQIASTDNAVSWIELDPARARQIDLHPCMGRTAPDIALPAPGLYEHIAPDETRGTAEPPQRFDHKKRIVAAASRARLQCIERMLGALLVPPPIGEALTDAMGHAAQDIEGRRWPLGVEELPRPGRQLTIGIAILRRDELC